MARTWPTGYHRAMQSPGPLVSIVSLGCPKNLVDSERICAILAEGGCVVGAPPEEADVIVINTCGFIQDARTESMEMIRQAVEQKRTGRAGRVVVAGCLVNRDGSDLLGAPAGIDAIVGVNDREQILQAVLGQGPGARLSPPGPACSDAGRFRLTPPHTAYLRIAEGCSRRCTFCTIPAIRGPYRSKPPEMVLAEAAELAADGAVEMNVIAQDTTSYGCDLDGPDLAGLLGQLDRIEGVEWIRLLYTYPLRFDRKLIDAMTAAEHVVPYVDMPLQHICTEILRRMGRSVGRETIVELLDGLRQALPGICLRTTMIVGFPGETERQFQELLEFIRDQRFEALGAFAYSPEPGTPAAEMPDPVPEATKAARLEAIMKAQQEISQAGNAARVGTELDVLVDGIDADGYCFGRHAGQAPDIDGICYLSEHLPPGRLVRARVVQAGDYDLVVEPVGSIR